VVNHVLLTLEALPKTLRAKAKIVLMTPRKPDVATASNLKLLGQFFPVQKIFKFPWLGRPVSLDQALKNQQVKRALHGLLAA
jgi:hypothetical protein